MSNSRLAVLDVDGTLKRAVSPYQYLHLRLGVADRAVAHRELALAGQISYGEWLRRDVELWSGQPVDRVRTLLSMNPYLPGARELIAALTAADVTVALVSAGFTLNTDPIAQEFGIQHVLANELTISDGRLDGHAINHVPEGGKQVFTENLQRSLGIAKEDTLAAGDTQGDLELFACAGIRAAVNPKCEELRAGADVVFEPDLCDAVGWLQRKGFLA